MSGGYIQKIDLNEMKGGKKKRGNKEKVLAKVWRKRPEHTSASKWMTELHKKQGDDFVSLFVVKECRIEDISSSLPPPPSLLLFLYRSGQKNLIFFSILRKKCGQNTETLAEEIILPINSPDNEKEGKGESEKARMRERQTSQTKVWANIIPL